MGVRKVMLAAALTLPLFFSALPAQSQVFSNLLSPLVQVWIRSQVQQVDDLQVTVGGPDARVINGQIDSIQLSGRNLQYQGVTARSIQLRGTDIRLDTRGALQGNGLRLLNNVRADLSLTLSETDVNNYLSSPGFQEQIRNLKIKLPTELGGTGNSEVPLEIRSPRVRLQRDRLELAAVVRVGGGEPATLRLSSGIDVAGPRQLRLVDPRLIDDNGTSVPIEALSNLPIQLGKELELRRVSILPGQLLLEGTYLIQATPPPPVYR